MATKQTYEVRVQLTDIDCDVTACPGHMEHDGYSRPVQQWRGDPALPGGIHMPQPPHRHRCSHCGASQWLTEKYPVIEYLRPTVEESEDETPASTGTPALPSGKQDRKRAVKAE